MTAAGDPALLRPLTLGEIFDRALTLYVRNFPLFTLIALAVVVPLAIVQYFVGLHESATFAQLLAQIQHPQKHAAPVQSAAQTGEAFLTIALAVLLNAFAIVAIAAGVGRLYRREPAEWTACYARALRRTGAILLTLLCEVASFFVVMFAGAFVMGIGFVVAFLLLRSAPALGVLATAVAALIAIAWFVSMLLCYLAYAFAFNALGIEGSSARAAIGSGFARIFNRSELLRAMLVCLALIVIYFGLSVVSLSIAGLFEAMKLHAIDVAASAVVSLIATALLGVLQAVYYYGVRVRREGLDMLAQIETLAPAGIP